MTMDFNGLFKKPQNTLEIGGRAPGKPTVEAPVELCVTCPACSAQLPLSELWDRLYVCDCGYHFRVTARQHLAAVLDGKSFEEMNPALTSTNLLGFPGYDEKLEAAHQASSEKEAVVTGLAAIGGIPVAVFAMEANFMMGSMGTVVGEKITQLFELAAEHALPVVGFTVSGGARMQEGILSLMQMAKVSAAVQRHSAAGLLYVAVLTDPTTGGVTASFAMEGDVTIAEPDALIGFAGQRVIEQNIHKKLPKGFQLADFVLDHGFIDDIVARPQQRTYLTRLLRLHGYEPEEM
jgi:acetyl-CoA carboxylase carboxyl transferase beta subunit